MSETASERKALSREKLFNVETHLCRVTNGYTGKMPGDDVFKPILEVDILEGPQKDTKGKYGLVTEEVVEKVLSKGYEENGSAFVYLPEQNLEKPITWVKVL